MGNSGCRVASFGIDPEYSLALDQNQSSGFATKPRRTGFRWIYSTARLYSPTVLNARSKNRPCQTLPASLRLLFICRVELTLMDSITSEIVFAGGAYVPHFWHVCDHRIRSMDSREASF